MTRQLSSQYSTTHKDWRIVHWRSAFSSVCGVLRGTMEEGTSKLTKGFLVGQLRTWVPKLSASSALSSSLPCWMWFQYNFVMFIDWIMGEHLQSMLNDCACRRGMLCVCRGLGRVLNTGVWVA